jgi:hypothetical protein
LILFLFNYNAAAVRVLFMFVGFIAVGSGSRRDGLFAKTRDCIPEYLCGYKSVLSACCFIEGELIRTLRRTVYWLKHYNIMLRI